MSLRNLPAFLFLLFFSFSVQAQENAVVKRATMNLELSQYIAANPNSDEMINILVQGSAGAISSIVHSDGGILKYAYGDIVAVRMPLNKINLLTLTPQVKRIEARHGYGVLLDDQTDFNADITPVKQGDAPLVQGYNGKGVVVGIIDDGIDISHPDFKDSLGHTRIKYLWAQDYVSGGTVPSYGYGREWNADSIDAGTCHYLQSGVNFGHGSNVAGIAAGNGLAVNNYYGVATHADLVVVDADLGGNILNNIADAADYIYAKANLLGEPCVINVSAGTYNGSHDGHDLPAKMIDNLITAQNGRSFVCAAGNAGDRSVHLGYQVRPDSLFTWFTYSVSLGRVYFDLWGDKKRMDSMQFAIGADKISPYSSRGRTPFYNMLSDFNMTSGVDSVSYALKSGSDTIGQIKIYAEMQDSSYHLYFHIFTDSTAYNWRFITFGGGRFDLWAQPNKPVFTTTSNMVRAGLPSALTFPDIARYVLPDLTQNIVTSFTCSDKTITVANFNNRHSWTDYNNTVETLPTCGFTTLDSIAGAINSTSSIGPTRDGRIKPDIGAPGNYTFGSGLLSLMPTFISANSCKVGVGGMHVINTGTSMASPVVAGIVALYLQKRPNASWQEIKDVLLQSAKHDSFTGNNLPDNQWGYGKVDAFAALNYYGCKDKAALNYDSLSVIDDGSCSYFTVIPGSEVFTASLSNYPNPYNGFTAIHYNVNAGFNTASIVVTNMLGKMITSIPVKEQQGIINFDGSLVHSGVYFYRLVIDGNVVAAKKMVIF